MFLALAEKIIRPPRTTYSADELATTLPALQFSRVDYSIVNSQLQTLEVSLYQQPNSHFGPRPKLVVYLHGNSGCRVEANYLLPQVLGAGLDLLTFDCSGSGNSDGQHVGMGVREVEDLFSVVRHSRYFWKYEQFVLWGRSMGAVTAIKFAQVHPLVELAGIVADSCYCDLKELILELVQQKYFLPPFLTSPLINMVFEKAFQVSGVDLNLSNTLREMTRVKPFVVFIASVDDQVVPQSHSQRIAGCLPEGRSRVLYTTGKHNGARSERLLAQALALVVSGGEEDETLSCTETCADERERSPVLQKRRCAKFSK